MFVRAGSGRRGPARLASLGALGPISAALVVTAVVGGKPALAEFAGRILRWRMGTGWFLVSVFSPFLIFALSALIVRLLSGACPIVGSYGAKDDFTRRSANRLERALAANGVPYDVKVYPGAGHSFLNDHRDTMFSMMRIAGIGNHEPSARDARRRVVSFFDEHLKP